MRSWVSGGYGHFFTAVPLWCIAACCVCVFVCSDVHSIQLSPSSCWIFILASVCIPLLYPRSLSQARVNGLKSCVIILRILRDMCNRHSIWEPLKGWVSRAVITSVWALILWSDKKVFCSLCFILLSTVYQGKINMLVKHNQTLPYEIFTRFSPSLCLQFDITEFCCFFIIVVQSINLCCIYRCVLSCSP